MENKKRIGQFYHALLWFSKQSTADVVKLNFNTMVDTVSEKCKEGWERYINCSADISHIWSTGTDEERKLINEVIEKFDKECHSNINKKGGK